MFKKLKLKSKILILTLGINLVILLSIFAIYFTVSRSMVVSETKGTSLEKVVKSSIELDGFLKEKCKVGWTIANNETLRRWLSNTTVRGVNHIRERKYRNIIKLFKKVTEKDQYIIAVFMASEKTQEYWEDYKYLLPKDYYVGKREWYRKTKSLRRPYTDVDVNFLDKKIYLSHNVPIYANNGEMLGVAGMDISLQHLTEVMKKLGGVFSTGEAYLIGRDGTYYYHPNQKYILKKHITDFKDDGKLYKGIEAVSRKILNHQSGISEVVFNGEHRYFMYTPVESVGWSLVLSVSSGEINSPLVHLARTSLIIIIFTVIFLVIAVLFITGSISRPINHLVVMLKDIAEGEGDLTSRLEVTTDDEIGELARWFNIFVEKVHSVIYQVKENAGEVDKATQEISSTSTELASGIEEQTSQLSEVAVSIQQMSSGIVQNSRSTEEAAQRAEEASKVAQQGLGSIQDTREGMNKISITADKAAEIIKKLSERVDKIGEVVWVISDIAAQTKVLSLNASIEAATTESEGGEGFVVVAEEVRNLVKQTKDATERISDKISSIRQDTDSALLSMGDVQGVVEQGLEISGKTEEIFEEITKIVTSSLHEIKQISSVSIEQSTGAETISHSISSVSAVAKQSARGIEMLSEAANRLKKQTEDLNDMVNQFRLKEGHNNV